MLEELAVKNLGILESARIDPGPGFTVITGETGAGKTLLLGALRMLLGADARPELVGPFGEEAHVEGRFLTEDGAELAAARRLPRSGRSKAYLDGSIASAVALDEATVEMVEVIGQHDQLRLTRPSEARRLVDRHLDPEGVSVRQEYTRAWERLRGLLEDRRELGGGRTALERERDLAEFQLTEIDGARIDLGRDVELESRIDRMRHADTIRQHLDRAAELVEEARERFAEAVGDIRRAGNLAGDGDLEHQTGSIEAELNELAQRLGGELSELEIDPAELTRAEERMQVLGEMRRKYGSDLEAVLSYRTQLAERHRELTELLERADRLEAMVVEAEAEVVALGARLRNVRAEAGARLSEAALQHLIELGFGTPLLIADVEAAEPTAAGADAVSIRFASDSRLEAGDIARVASGGELSRLVLSLRLAGGAGDVATVVFDEIDAGVGGVTALAVGRKLANLARDRQVLCVTHLPQVAVFADTHYVVARGDITATVTRVEGPERLDELSRMMSGLPEGDRAKRAAEELLDLARATPGTATE
ncbi:MAG TPA: AAA family ATPase [Acidimicrobiia bacterium]